MRSAVVLGLAASTLAAPSLMERQSSCESTVQGNFEISVVQGASKRSLEARASDPLIISLKNGQLKDSKNRIGNIVANKQFQFDPDQGQPHAIITGYSVCTEGGHQYLAHEGGNTDWKRCLSGGFYNLYSTNNAAQCEDIKLWVIPVNGDVGQAGDGQITQIPDGQIQATGAVTQIGDGQVQAPTGKIPVITQIGDGQLQAPTGVVSQIGDGQVQAPTGVVSQIGDGQVQAPTGVVSQIGDGQVQAPTGVVSQIGDGQVQAPTGVVTQIGDGQVQAPTGVVTQIGDGQVQAPTGVAPPPAQGTPQTTPPPTAAGSHIIPGSFALVLAAVGAVFAL